MKITIDEKPAAPRIEYPCLMESTNGALVLFSEPRVGFAIRHFEGPHHYHDWAMDLFTPFTGSVTLSND